jgi:hypothetical protein
MAKWGFFTPFCLLVEPLTRRYLDFPNSLSRTFVNKGKKKYHGRWPDLIRGPARYSEGGSSQPPPREEEPS